MLNAVAERFERSGTGVAGFADICIRLEQPLGLAQDSNRRTLMTLMHIHNSLLEEFVESTRGAARWRG